MKQRNIQTAKNRQTPVLKIDRKNRGGGDLKLNSVPQKMEKASKWVGTRQGHQKKHGKEGPKKQNIGKKIRQPQDEQASPFFKKNRASISPGKNRDRCSYPSATRMTKVMKITKEKPWDSPRRKKLQQLVRPVLKKLARDNVEEGHSRLPRAGWTWLRVAYSRRGD